MYKKAKFKIVISILSMLCAVLVGTLGMVYLSSYLSATSRNRQVLEMRSEEIIKKLDSDDNGNSEPSHEQSLHENKHNNEEYEHDNKNLLKSIEIGTFYAVKLSKDGNESVIVNDAEQIYSDDELISIAKNIYYNNAHADDLLYTINDYNGDIIICLMDNSVFTEGFTRLLTYTLIFGVIAIIIITFLSIYIANRIVRPMEDNYRKQKQFNSDAGHELKTPIAAMAANIELLQREIGKNNWLENIAYENNRMHDLVSELLELSNNENRIIHRSNTDLSRLVNRVVIPLEATAFENNILIDTYIPDGIYAFIDEKSVTQLVSVLVDNAISHTESTPDTIKHITVSLAKETGGPVLSVSNPGPEIPESEREKIFERFYRSDDSHEFKGHYGLGLSIAKAVADANNAKIIVLCNDGLVTFKVRFSEK